MLDSWLVLTITSIANAIAAKFQSKRNKFIKPLPTRLTPPHEALLIEVYYRFRFKNFLFLNRS